MAELPRKNAEHLNLDVIDRRKGGVAALRRHHHLAAVAPHKRCGPKAGSCPHDGDRF